MQTGSPLRIGITCGDPNGIGPEVVLKTLATQEAHSTLRVYGPVEALRVWARQWGLPWPTGPNLEWVDIPWDVRHTEWGRPSPTAGRWVARSLEAAAGDLAAGEVHALVTAPIMKKSLELAGYNAWDHTQFLDGRFGTRTVMSMITPRLRVAFVTAHVPLRRVAETLSPSLIVETVRIAYRDLVRWFRIPTPRVAICGLNPHAGEDGLIGEEEEQVVRPAVRALQSEGLTVEGPAPAETLFRQALEGQWDLVVALYHDQGMIPVKLLDFGQGVNLTMGLPFVRTSPDHGAAPDIAGRGVARPDGMRAALALALQILDALRTPA
jgi:4-hydroxythreonine-4-phosphate dehydrogenase